MQRIKEQVSLTAAEREALEMDWEEPGGPGPWRVTPIALFLLAALGYLPLAGLLGFCTFSISGKFFAGSLADPLINFALYLVGVHLMLSWPISRFAYPQVSQFNLRAQRILVTTLLLAAPLLSYGYFRGGAKDLFAVHELCVAVIPVVIIAAVSFELTKRLWLLTLVLTVGTFVPFYLVNDILGDMPTYFKYASDSAGFYAVRTLGPLTGTVLAFATLKSPPEKEAIWRELRWGGLVLIAYGFLVSFVVPMVAASVEKSAWHAYFRVDLHLPVLILCSILLGITSRRSELLKLIGIAEASILLVEMVRLLLQGQFTFWELSKILYWGVLAFYFGLLAYRVARSRLPVLEPRE